MAAMSMNAHARKNHLLSISLSNGGSSCCKPKFWDRICDVGAEGSSLGRVRVWFSSDSMRPLSNVDFLPLTSCVYVVLRSLLVTIQMKVDICTSIT